MEAAPKYDPNTGIAQHPTPRRTRPAPDELEQAKDAIDKTMGDVEQAVHGLARAAADDRTRALEITDRIQDAVAVQMSTELSSHAAKGTRSTTELVKKAPHAFVALRKACHLVLALEDEHKAVRNAAKTILRRLASAEIDAVEV